MNNQEAFNTIVDGFKADPRFGIDHDQHEESLKDHGDDDNAGVCVYRGPKGERCAAGKLIPDELYDPSMENKMIDVVISEYEKLEEYLANVSYSFILRMQAIHDGWAVEWSRGSGDTETQSVQKMLDQMTEVARNEFGLRVSS